MELGTLETWFTKKIPDEEARSPLYHLFQSTEKGHLCIEWPHPLSCSFPIVQNKGLLYFKSIWQQETRLLEAFKALISSEPEISFHAPDLHGFSLVEAQENAILLALKNRLTFITGGPGTGKTHTAGCLMKAMLSQASELRIAVAAPTGRAVGQLKESLLKHVPSANFSACTLHRLLELWYQEASGFPANILPFDVILCDEASMMDLRMMARLFESLKPGARLILMGDPWQLPPVEAGSVFSDLAPFAQTAHLTQCLRAELKEIVELSEVIRTQDADRTIHLLKQSHQGIFWKNTDNFDFPVAEMTTLTPLRKGKWGSEGLNQKALKENPRGPYPILITRNHDALELYNGDRGTLFSLKPALGNKALFGKREIPALFLSGYELAWALSIHKSQGSEFDAVRTVWPEGSVEFGVAALYTAVTRAKRYVEIWSPETTLRQIIETSSHRNSGIRARLAT